jgi:hypothetical protein
MSCLVGFRDFDKKEFYFYRQGTYATVTFRRYEGENVRTFKVSGLLACTHPYADDMFHHGQGKNKRYNSECHGRTCFHPITACGTLWWAENQHHVLPERFRGLQSPLSAPFLLSKSDFKNIYGSRFTVTWLYTALRQPAVTSSPWKVDRDVHGPRMMRDASIVSRYCT